MPKRRQYNVITIRVTDEMFNALPPASLHGHRAQFIRDAIKDKIEKEKRIAAQRREAQA